MSFDLRYESWLPFRRLDGRIEWGPPALLLDGLGGPSPVVAVASPRPDFDGALQEFLIGLLTVAFLPEDEEEWRERWEQPPSPGDLAERLQALPPAFDLDGDGPRFLQDFAAAELEAEAPSPIQDLLVELAGAEEAAIHLEPFKKSARVTAMGRPAAAMALITLQAYAPSGGRGHRTSLRGGGPLTTLVDPRPRGGADGDPSRQALWYKLWANLETREDWGARSPVRTADRADLIFPWLAPTRVSSSKLATTPADAHPLQCYFGMPRRVRLEFGASGRCELTGRQDERRTSEIRMKAYGAQYLAWEHPLTPHYQARGKPELMPIHGRAGGLGWKDWLGMTLGTAQGDRRPAQCVANFLHKRARWTRSRRSQLHVFGYDMDNMKALGWSEGEVPVLTGLSEEDLGVVRDLGQSLVNGVDSASRELQQAVDRALYPDPRNVGGDRTLVRDLLWGSLEDEFYGTIREFHEAGAPVELAGALRSRFARALRESALRIFDEAVPTGASGSAEPRRVVAARYSLNATLDGRGKSGARLYDQLGLAPPVGATIRRGKQQEVRA